MKECMEAIVENAGLDLTQVDARVFLDNKSKIGVLSNKKGNYRFFKQYGKEYHNFIYLNENDNGTKTISLVARNANELKSATIYSYGCDIVVRNPQNHYNTILNLFNCVDKYLVRYDDDNEKYIAPQEFRVQDIYDEICNVIVNMDDSENWKNEISEILDFAKPALILFIERSKEIWLNSISSLEASLKDRYDAINTQYEQIKDKRDNALKEYKAYKEIKKSLEESEVSKTIDSIKK